MPCVGLYRGAGEPTKFGRAPDRISLYAPISERWEQKKRTSGAAPGGGRPSRSRLRTGETESEQRHGPDPGRPRLQK